MHFVSNNIEAKYEMNGHFWENKLLKNVFLVIYYRTARNAAVTRLN